MKSDGYGFIINVVIIGGLVLCSIISFCAGESIGRKAGIDEQTGRNHFYATERYINGYVDGFYHANKVTKGREIPSFIEVAANAAAGDTYWIHDAELRQKAAAYSLPSVPLK